MRRFAFALSLLAVSASPVFGASYPQMTLKSDSIICFSGGDWRDMKAAAIDQDEAGMQRLISSGACRLVNQSMRVSYLDPAAGGGALIQLPSGKTAYTADAFLSK
ncbi:hypothetical protein [Stutzerimonas stutzeri]|uniref:hypothetical protein n=1 Tax=Stutzerimonas stutzeri TaxID=316 RepID=UPI0005A14ABA|nr:hypothetical protein [Stutzerimonas stutzeri]